MTTTTSSTAPTAHRSFAADLLLPAAQLGLRYAEQLVTSAPADSFARMPMKDVNSAAFNIGHLSTYGDRVCAMLGRNDLITPMPYSVDLFKAGAPCLDQPGLYPEKDVLVATFFERQRRAIEAFRGRERTDVFILFPEGRVSDVQRRQMTTPSEANVHAVAIDGTFDDAQARVKDMFNDFAFRDEVGLAGVNSINWARVLAQVVYYFSAAVSLGAPGRKVSFTVPTGNFGDVFAGYIAKQMGLPIERLVVATNQNDILHRCLSTGAYIPDGVQPSISPSMDIQVSSNFERALYFAYGKDGAAVAGLMEELKAGGFTLSQGVKAALAGAFDSGRCSEAETSATITATLKNAAELLCPHTAVGVKVAEEQRVQGVPMITLATAHPAKFPDAVEAASGIRPGLPPHMADLFERPERVTRLSNDLSALEAHVREHRRK